MWRGRKNLSFQILAKNQKQQHRIFANFSMFFLMSQPKDVFWKQVHLVKYSTKQPLEDDKEITIHLMVIMQQQNKKCCVFIFKRWERKLQNPCSLCYNSKIFLFCFIVFWQDMTQTLLLPGQDQKKILPSRRRMHQCSIFSCLPGRSITWCQQ